jgi:transposase
MVKDPDVIDDRIPDYCKRCGNGLSQKESRLVGQRQLIDIPPRVPVVTEERIYERTCICGHRTCGQFSPNANAQVGYGPNTEALVAYLHARQYLPVARMSEMFNDLLGMPISTGGIYHKLNRFAKKTTPIYEEIKGRLQDSPFVGSDPDTLKLWGR